MNEVKSIVAKGEIEHIEQFLLLSQYLQKLFAAVAADMYIICGKGVNIDWIWKVLVFYIGNSVTPDLNIF